MKYIKTLSAITGIILLFIGIFIYLNSPPSLMQDDTVSIKEGDTLKTISGKLKRKNLITNRRFLILLGIATRRTNIKTGRYKIFRGMSSSEILRKVIRGDLLRKKVTIPEGFNLYQIADRLHNLNITEYNDFISQSFNSAFIRSLGIKSSSAEGYLFPDTYPFQEEADAREIIAIMYNRLKSVIKKTDMTLLKKYRFTIHQALTFAPMIEKEARIPGERTYISSVFHNRLARGMRFDCDPTVRYAVKKFKGRISYRDLKYDSPYNTYIHRGFPPTPICSPGLASIQAALSPAASDFLYFVSRNDGSHYFSKTNREHSRAVEYYQKGNKNGFIDRQRLQN